MVDQKKDPWKSDLNELEQRVDRRFDGFESQLDKIVRKLDNAQTTDWKTWLGFAALILSIVQLGASPYKERLEYQENRVAKIEDKVAAASGNRWTRTDETTQQAKELKETRRLETMIANLIKDFDTNVQREMRLLDAVVLREVQGLLDAPSVRIQHLSDQLDEIKTELNSRGGLDEAN